VSLRIHQITHLFHPDQIAGASLYTDLAAYLRDRGHDVRVTTTFSYYPSLRFADADRGILRREERFDNIPLRRIGQWLPQPHKGWRRLVPELTFLAALSFAGRFRNWTPDVVITACPMLAQVSWQRWLYVGKNVPRLVIVQDSMAHAATELGIIKSRWLGRLLHGFERWSLGSATLISTISEGMKVRVNGITRGEVPCVVTPNWIHQSLSDTIASRRDRIVTRTKARLFYSGNFGIKQGLPGFLRDFKDARGEWTIAVHGGGAEAETLRNETAGWGDWLLVGPLLEESAYVDELLSAAACVVTQMPGVGANFLPSKLLPALAAGTPVLAVCDLDTPLGREVTEGGYGEVVRPGDATALRSTLDRWAREPSLLEKLGRKARLRAELYSRERSCGAYEKLLEQLVAQAKGRKA
jgi:colanic acid biosynthesis glycosyl transferase WcaI